MERLLIAAVLIVVAVAVALAVQRRGRPAPPVRTGWTVPDHLDRADFDRPDASWLVVLFSSSSCDSCAGTWEKVRHLESPAVAVQDVAFQDRGDLHRRYEIDAVPCVLVVDADGVTQASFLGPVTATDLWAAVADVRSGGSGGPAPS